jgi:hypothetical protein
MCELVRVGVRGCVAIGEDWCAAQGGTSLHPRRSDPARVRGLVGLLHALGEIEQELLGDRRTSQHLFARELPGGSFDGFA